MSYAFVRKYKGLNKTDLTRYWQPAAAWRTVSGAGSSCSRAQVAAVQAASAAAAASSELICSEERQSTSRTTDTSARSQASPAAVWR